MTILKPGANVMGMVCTPCNGADECITVKQSASQTGNSAVSFVVSGWKLGAYIAVRVSGQSGTLTGTDNSTANKCASQIYHKDPGVDLDPPTTTSFDWTPTPGTNSPASLIVVWSPGGGFGGGYVRSQNISIAY
jgi:hypothetical protein